MSYSDDLKKPKKCLSAYMIFVKEVRLIYSIKLGVILKIIYIQSLFIWSLNCLFI